MEIGKVFGDTPRASASHFVCMCVLSLYTLYVSGMLSHVRGRGEGGGGRKSTDEKREKVGGVLTPFISKK